MTALTSIEDGGHSEPVASQETFAGRAVQSSPNRAEKPAV